MIGSETRKSAACGAAIVKERREQITWKRLFAQCRQSHGDRVVVSEVADDYINIGPFLHVHDIGQLILIVLQIHG